MCLCWDTCRYTSPRSSSCKTSQCFQAESGQHLQRYRIPHKCIRVVWIYGYIAAGIAQAPKQMVMHDCIRRNAQHVRQSTCFMPSIACLMSSALSLLLCHASCMVNTQGGVLRRMCCTAFGTLHPPAEHRKLHVDDQHEWKLVHSQTVPDRHQWHGSLWYLHVCKNHSTIQACNGHSTAIGGAMLPLSVSQDFWLWPSMSLRASPRGWPAMSTP